MPKRKPNKQTRTRRPHPKCGICGGKHYALTCPGNLASKLLNGLVPGECARCGGPIELLGPYCIACAVDRAIERIRDNNTPRKDKP